MTKENFERQINALVSRLDVWTTASLFAFGQELMRPPEYDGVQALLNSLEFISRHFDAEPFVIGRKNLLFANTPLGAQGSAVIYSLMETAKENGLDPYRYLLWVLSEAPKLALTGDGWAELLTPANATENSLILISN